jgi:ubiquinone/menaquinone biosynthesis C-methylase UbiE
MPKPESRPRICDYEGSNYRTEFWEGKGRDYEDQVERIALRRLLPSSGRRLLEIGAGFGRLTEEYNGYQQVVLLDYSFSQLQYAQEHLGDEDRYLFVAADAYHLPFHPGVFDGATMIRVIHHLADAPTALEQVRRVLNPKGVFILEHANKRHFKSMLRYALNQQAWNPYSLEPVEFVELNFDYHPEYIQRELRAAGFQVEARLPVSFFRLDAFKNHLPTGLLTWMDSVLQLTGLLYSPSIFVKNVAVGDTPDNVDSGLLFACPHCGSHLIQEANTMVCPTESLRWAVRGGIYDFKAPLD